MPGKTLRDQGVVLRTVKLGEADRIVTILTSQHGKIKGVAKGARKSGSKYSARLESASVVDFQWIVGTKELVRITQTDAVAAYRNIRESLELLSSAARMLDAVDILSEDHSAHNDLARMTIRALATMDSTRSTNVCGIFLFRILSLEGFAPDTSSCPRCNRTEDLTHFSLNHGAFFCNECSTGQMIRTLAHTRESIAAVNEGKVSAVIENMPTEVAHELETLAIAMIEHHAGRQMRAVSII